ncbi:YALIA101S11e01926g1_1 [Yarrowia lipolytica]|nr:YALIA101S11e01926g1_1 [Yarrowia lipolytica]
MGLLASVADAKDNTRHTVQQITAYCNTAKYNECHAAAANNYLACAENDVNCRCTQLQVLADVCAPLCPQTEVSNAELIRSYCAQSTLQSYSSASVAAAGSANDVHSNSLMELKKKLKEKLFGKFKDEDPDCPDDKHEDHGDDCPEDKHNNDQSDDGMYDDCHDKCDGDDHHDDCDNKYDEDDEDDCDDKYDHDDHHEDDCDEKYDGEDDDCDEECDEYDHHDDCAQYYSYANQSDSPSPSSAPSPQPESDESPALSVQSKNFLAMMSAYEKDSSDHASIPGRFHRRSTIERLKATASRGGNQQLHIVPRGLDLLDVDEPNARLFRDFLPSSMDPDCDGDDDEDCVIDGLDPSLYEDVDFDSLQDQRASANIIGWPSIPWPWNDDDQQDDDCEDDKTPEHTPVDDDCGDEEKDQWNTPSTDDDCGDEEKDQWNAPSYDDDDCGDEDKSQWNAPSYDDDDCGDEDKSQWNTPSIDDDCGDEDKDQWNSPSEADDDCGEDSDKSWNDHSGDGDDDCGDDSDKQPSYDKSKHKVSGPDADADETHGDDGDDGDDSDGHGDDGSGSDDDADDGSEGDSEEDGSDTDTKVDGGEGKNATEGSRQGLRNAIKNVGANIRNATGSGVESSATSVVRQGMVEVIVGFAAAAGVGFALI